MGDGSGDLQRVWHEFAADLWSDTTILDLGAGIGRSKDRLARNGNIVTTQDIARDRMTCVDLICQPEWIASSRWDVVTAFDVIEHAAAPKRFLREAWRLARREVLFTTPNVIHSPAPWHFSLNELQALITEVTGRPCDTVYGRFKNSEGERIEPLGKDDDARAVAFGMHLRWPRTP